MNTDFDLLLFATDPAFIRNAAAAGINNIVVDWENQGKKARQVNLNTEINYNTLADLEKVRAATKANIICRINSFGKNTQTEIEQAANAGADEILLPMVKTQKEVEKFINFTSYHNVKAGILVETLEAVKIIENLKKLPLSRIYIGLNDLAISKKVSNIFLSIQDGTIEKICQTLRNTNIKYGFGGLTLPEKGYPIPSRLLLSEMVRLNCKFSVLRRSFIKDIAGKDLAIEILHLKQTIEQTRLRSPEQVDNDMDALHKAIQTMDLNNAIKR